MPIGGCSGESERGCGDEMFPAFGWLRKLKERGRESVLRPLLRVSGHRQWCQQYMVRSVGFPEYLQ